METGVHRTAHVIFETLKAYPMMIANHGVLPPIIHPSIIPLHADGKDMEPLQNCTALLHLLRSGVQGSPKLFWGNVQRECEGFRATV